MHMYTQIPGSLNSRAIREITFNMNASRYLMPSLCADMVQYVIDNRDYVMGDTVEKVLYCCYNLGYQPRSDEVLDAALHIINRWVIGRHSRGSDSVRMLMIGPLFCAEISTT